MPASKCCPRRWRQRTGGWSLPCGRCRCRRTRRRCRTGCWRFRPRRCCADSAPDDTGAQTPSGCPVRDRAQALQPEHALPQHTPSAQMPLAQTVPTAQGLPLGNWAGGASRFTVAPPAPAVPPAPASIAPPIPPPPPVPMLPPVPTMKIPPVPVTPPLPAETSIGPASGVVMGTSGTAEPSTTCPKSIPVAESTPGAPPVPGRTATSTPGPSSAVAPSRSLLLRSIQAAMARSPISTTMSLRCMRVSSIVRALDRRI